MLWKTVDSKSCVGDGGVGLQRVLCGAGATEIRVRALVLPYRISG
jgi:hypothetical protein